MPIVPRAGRLVRFAATASALAFLLGASVARAQSYDEALQAFQAGDFATSIPMLEALVAQGSAPAHALLGFHFQNGHGTAPDFDRVEELYQRAGDLGDPYGYAALGQILDLGTDLPHDAERAQALFEKAAEMGSAAGMLYAAEGLITARGTPPDYARAVALLQEVISTTGDPHAMTLLAGLQVLGWGTEQHLPRARRTYLRLQNYYLEQGETRKAGDMGTLARSVSASMEDGRINRFRYLPPRYMAPFGDDTMEETREKMQQVHDIALMGLAKEIARERRGGGPRCSHQAPAAGVLLEQTPEGLTVRAAEDERAPTVLLRRGGRMEKVDLPISMPEDALTALRAQVTERVGRLRIILADGSELGAGWPAENFSVFAALQLGSDQELSGAHWRCSGNFADALGGEGVCRAQFREMWETFSRLPRDELQGAFLEFHPQPGLMGYRRSLDLLPGMVYATANSANRDGDVDGTATMKKCE